MKKISPTVLSCIAVVGVVGTAITTAQSTPKAMKLCESLRLERVNACEEEPTKLEYLKECWHCYIPSILIGSATIVCILGANGLNKRQQASLISAYALLDQTYRDYKAKTKELYGEDWHSRIQSEVVKNFYEQEDHPYDEEKVIFYEEHYGEFFERTKTQVREAEYLLNRKYALNGEANLNDFYNFLGLKETEIGDIFGWSKDPGYNIPNYRWIEFKHNKVELDDGMECYIIDMPFGPVKGYDVPF